MSRPRVAAPKAGQCASLEPFSGRCVSLSAIGAEDR